MIYEIECEIFAVLQAKRTTRKGTCLISAATPQEITPEYVNRDHSALARLVPRFVTGKLRDQYKVSRVLSVKLIPGLVGRMK